MLIDYNCWAVRIGTRGPKMAVAKRQKEKSKRREQRKNIRTWMRTSSETNMPPSRLALICTGQVLGKRQNLQKEKAGQPLHWGSWPSRLEGAPPFACQTELWGRSALVPQPLSQDRTEETALSQHEGIHYVQWAQNFIFPPPQREIPMKYIEKEGPTNKNLRKRSLTYKKFMYFWQRKFFYFHLHLGTLGCLNIYIYISSTFHCLFHFFFYFLTIFCFLLFLPSSHFFPKETTLSTYISCQSEYSVTYRWQLYQWLACRFNFRVFRSEIISLLLLKVLFFSVRDPYTWVQYQLHTHCVFTNIFHV